jgi:hypothetical protein
MMSGVVLLHLVHDFPAPSVALATEAGEEGAAVAEVAVAEVMVDLTLVLRPLLTRMIKAATTTMHSTMEQISPILITQLLLDRLLRSVEAMADLANHLPSMVETLLMMMTGVKVR